MSRGSMDPGCDYYLIPKCKEGRGDDHEPNIELLYNTHPYVNTPYDRGRQFYNIKCLHCKEKGVIDSKTNKCDWSVGYIMPD